LGSAATGDPAAATVHLGSSRVAFLVSTRADQIRPQGLHLYNDTAAAIDNCYVVGLHTSLARLVSCLAGHPIPWDWDGFADAQAHYASLGLAPVASGSEQA
jgi:hypothetical protein